MEIKAPEEYGLPNVPTVLGGLHSLTATSMLMLGERAGAGVTTQRGGFPIHRLEFPIDPEQYEGTFVLPWVFLILCEPLSIVIAYEQRRGVEYGVQGKPQDPFPVFCKVWLALWAWLEDARTRNYHSYSERGQCWTTNRRQYIYPHRMHIICMDRLGYPPRNGVFDFESKFGNLKKLIDKKDCAGLLEDGWLAPYIRWMRRHREIFDFVDSVGHYDSGWWLDP